ncbi:hypothetical protein [uncultured Sphaerochaeta sp.]|uniref:hypothetical protein n=1 Tax=uncultured Sphaerochaeta sp. TaxID=886478 RepID=UPI002A0A66C2|nr:hypothetical protein [uncultured Sphaerochaeta sp.]
MAQNYQYYVEGETEEKIIQVLKTDLQIIIPGKVKKFNVVEELFSPSHLTPLKRGTVAILVFDTDTDDSSIVQRNIKFLNGKSAIKSVFCIPQVKNLEEELIRCCNIRKIKELLSSKADRDFKKDVCNCNGLMSSLLKHEFDINKFWSGVRTKSWTFLRY